MNRDYPILDADVLIIGGGSAGAMAAVRAKTVNPDQRVVVFEKGDIKYSGCIARGMDALNIVAVPGVSDPDLYVESNRMACEGIMDEPVSHTLAERSWELLQRLEEWNVCFPKDEKGNYEILQVHPKGRFCLTMMEPELKTILAKKVEEAGVEVVNRIMAVRLLKDGDRVAGAIGMNVRTGEIIVCRAKATIISSGGTARFGLPDNGHLYGVYDFPGNTGDGYILAYNAGAELSGFEYTLVYYIVKDINAPLLYITLTRGAKLFNALNESRDKEHPSIRSMYKEHLLENRGPLRIEMSHLPEERIQEIEEILFTTERPACERFYKGRDVDFRRREIELWPTECFLCGGHGLTGVRVNERAETSVPGLFAAGDTSLVARGHLSGAFVFGEIAAESATELAKNGNVDPDLGQVDDFIEEMERRMSQKDNPVSIEEFEYKVRRIISDYIVPPKNEYKLGRAVWWMDRFRRELAEVVRVENVHDLFKVFEVENIIQCAKMSAAASLERKESRWIPWHYRVDYPETNDREWLKHIVLTKGDAMEDIRVTHAPIIRMEGGAGK